MEGRDRRAGPDRGGERIQTLRASPSLSWGAAAVALACVLGLTPALSEPSLLLLGVASVFVLVAGLALRRPAAVPWAVAGLAAAYAVSLDEGVDTRAPLYAVGLFALAELAYWSLQLRRGPRDEPGMAGRRALTLLFAGIVSLVLATLLVAVGGLPLRGGVAVEVVGLVAAVGALVVLLSVARATRR